MYRDLLYYTYSKLLTKLFSLSLSSYLISLIHFYFFILFFDLQSFARYFISSLSFFSYFLAIFCYVLINVAIKASGLFIFVIVVVVATTRRNGTRSLLTSAKLSVDYLVVGITRELDKKPLLYCSSIYINTLWSVLQQYLPALMSMPLPHVLLLICHMFSLRPLCFLHVP